jgi:hypothetical protein
VPRAGFSVSGTPHTHDRRADSGNVVTRAFCGTCGGPVFSTNSANPEVVFVRASSLDDPEAFAPGMIVYASRAPSWALLDPKLPMFQEMAPPEARPVKLD